jgi:hypothetical protein
MQPASVHCHALQWFLHRGDTVQIHFQQSAMFSPSKWRHEKKKSQSICPFRSLDYESSFPPRPHADGLHQSPLHVSARTRSQPWPSSRPVASPQQSTQHCLAQFTAINTILHQTKLGKPKFRKCINGNVPIPVNARCKTWVCGRSLAGIEGSDPTERGVSECDLEASTMWRPRPIRAVEP